MNEVLTIDETRKLLRIGRRQAYEAVRLGTIPSFRVGVRTIRVPRNVVERLLDNGGVGAAENIADSR